MREKARSLDRLRNDQFEQYKPSRQIQIAKTKSFLAARSSKLRQHEVSNDRYGGVIFVDFGSISIGCDSEVADYSKFKEDIGSDL